MANLFSVSSQMSPTSAVPEACAGHQTCSKYSGNSGGYDLKPLLPLLDEETGNWKQVRHNYMETLLQMFVDRWSKPLAPLRETNNLKWTGHYWEHGWPQMNDGPDNMAMYAWHQVPAIDMLFNQFDETNPQAQFGNIRAVKKNCAVPPTKQVVTVPSAKLMVVEVGTKLFKDFKRLGDWEYALGVNFMNQHLAHMTLTGARKYDYPPVFTYHSLLVARLSRTE